jgi:hypothetical protein
VLRKSTRLLAHTLTLVISQNLLALELVLLDGESHLEQVLLLLHVGGFETSGDGGTGVAASVHDVLPVVVLGVVEKSLDSGLGERPGTSVEGLLLAPNDRLGIRVRVEVVAELGPGEGVELLNTGDRCVGDLVGLTVLEQGGEDLAGTEDDTLDLFGLVNLEGGVLGVHGVLDDPPEVALTSEVLDVRASEGVTQKSLGEEGDERLAELTVHLATENVEVVGRGGAVGDLHVAVLVLTVESLRAGEDARVLVTELQEALHTAGRVFGTLAVVTVGHGHDQTRTLKPLDLTRSDELVNDALSVVGKVTELGLPDDESVGRGEGVTVLEAEDTELRQAGVADTESTLVLADVLERSVGTL